MDDPELQGDEQFLIRTQGVHVKSGSFEAILTNKRIILVDREKNILTPKEIPLATIQSVASGENAIRDLVITLGLITKTGGTRQMVLTFFREGGGNRIKERDEWVRQIRAHLTPSFEQGIRKVIPGSEMPPTEQNPVLPPVSETPGSSPTAKKIVDYSPEPGRAPPATSPASECAFGIYCTRCGTKVPEGSGFCNKCGTRIILPGESPEAPVLTLAPSIPVSPAPKERPLDRDIQSIEPLIEKSPLIVPRDPLRSVPPVPEVRQPEPPAQAATETPVVTEQPSVTAVPPAAPQTPLVTEQPSATAVPPAASQEKKQFIPRLFSPKDLPPTPLVPSSMPTAVSPPPKKPANKKKILLAAGIIVIILIAVVAVVVVLPKMGSLGNILPGSNGSASSTTPIAPTVTTKSSSSASTTVVAATHTPVAIPQTGVYVYVNYIGGWKGTYGISDSQLTETNSGERIRPVMDATGAVATGTVTASFWKLDGSSHAITVSIYKDGKVLTSSNSIAPYGKVTLSVDTTTGVAQQPVVS
ncbi:zinc-ribbon domain-containing protein [Methanoregula sp.]|uniref:zinc-ribbon domain-containing protein n=1 Tax=Methanoregula sp. TaxID=2052170 RepID=UPI003561BE1D